MLDALWTDVRHSVRGLRRSPAFSLIVVATFALAIGANTTIFSLLNAIVLRTVAVSDPDRLVAISTDDPQTTRPGYIYKETFEAFRAQQRSLATLSMYSGGAFRIEVRHAAVDVGIEGITSDYLTVAGVGLAAGRFLADADDIPTAAAVPVVITDRIWRRMFDADPHAIGETVKINGRPATVVGITAPGFSGLQRDAGADLFMPLAAFRTLAGDGPRAGRAPYVIGRLAPGITLEQARAEVLARWPAILAATVPSVLTPAEQRSLRSQTMTIESLATGFSVMRQQYGSSLMVLIGFTAVLLAIGCVNLAGLLLARTLARQQEIAVRLALGAGRARLVQELLIDGVLLALCGFVAALPLAWWSSRMFTAMSRMASTMTLLRPLTPDARVLIVTAIVAVVTGLATGVIPAVRAIRGGADIALRPGRAVAATLGQAGRWVVVVQAALSIVLLVGAGLFAGTLSRLRANDAPLRTRPVVWTRLDRNPGDRGPLGRSYFQPLVQQLSTMHGADGAALSFYFPAFLGFVGTLPTDSYALLPEGASPAIASGLTELISPGFFDLFGIPRLRGRDFTWADDDHAPPVAIVSEAVVRRLFPSGDAIGRHIRVTSGAARTDVEVVGVVGDAPIGTLREPHRPVLFRPMMQDPARAQFPNTHVRVRGDVQTVRDEYVRVVESQGHHFIRRVFTLDQWVDYALLQQRLIAGLSTAAAGLALLLACLGMYGLLAYAVTARVREIGVRMALGATQGAVVRMIVREGAIVVLAGVLVGIAAALAAGRLIRSQLYELAPGDPTTIAAASIVFIAAGLAAALVPAWRASRLDPMNALRQD